MEMAETAKHPELNTTSKQSEIGMPGQFNGLALEAKFNPNQRELVLQVRTLMRTAFKGSRAIY